MDHNALTRGERRILELIKRCDFTGDGCYPTQEELAFLSGYKRPYVNSLTMSLRRKGLLRVEKRRRPGCKWEHNVYFVRDWNPNVRRGICNLRRAFQESRRPCSDTERTATPSRAQTPVAGPQARALSPRCFAVEGPTTVVARRENRCPDCGFQISEGSVCENCRRFAEENSELSNEVSGLLATTRRQARTIAGLESELRKRAKESPEAKDIRAVLEDWESHRKGKPNIAAGGKRWKVVEHAMKLGHTDPPLDAVRDELLEALEGLRLVPFVGPKGRTAGLEPGCRRYDDVEHALRDEATIERFRGYARRARMTRVERLRAAVEAAQNVEQSWFRLWVSAAVSGNGSNGNGGGA